MKNEERKSGKAFFISHFSFVIFHWHFAFGILHLPESLSSRWQMRYDKCDMENAFLLVPASSLIPHPSNDRHQPTDFSLNILLTSIGEKEIGAAHRTEWRYVDSRVINAR
jgi:hypothetical protein